MIEESDDINEKNEDEYLITRNILLKNYQIKLVEKAKQNNTIIYLPTGSGKTLIAVHVLLSRTKDIIKPFGSGGKIAFFATNTKVMTYQIAKVLQTHTKFKISHFNGDMNIDSWNREKWNITFGKTQVIILTGEILKQILVMRFIDPSEITLIVFDECHHSVAEHPFNLVLQFISDSDAPEKPLLLGLSAVLLNCNPKSTQVYPFIQSLENSFGGKIVTETELEEIMTLATNPTEAIIAYPSMDKAFLETSAELYNDFTNMLSKMVLKTSESFAIPEDGLFFRIKNKMKRIRNGVSQAKAHLDELGLFGGSISALFFIILFEKFGLMSQDEKEIQVLAYARTELNKIRHFLLKSIRDENSTTVIFESSSPKIQTLINLLVQVSEINKGKNFSTIIFVHQRATAVILAFLLKRLSEINEKYSFIKADFVVGSTVLSKETVFLGSKTEDIVQRFASGSLNVLVATNILEEGIDIPTCNVVISFDFPHNYPSYFQSKGRARNRESFYYVFSEESETARKTLVLEGYRNIGNTLMEEICEDFKTVEEEEEEEREEVEKIIIPGKTRAIIVDGISAIKVIGRYCAKLPQDRFSLLAPITWYIINNDKKKKGFVQLPTNCPLYDTVEGEWKDNKRAAKRSCFLATLKRLVEMGELDDDLNLSFEVKEKSFNHLFPHYVAEKVDTGMPLPGTRKRKQIYKMKFAEALSNCLPTPGVKTYLHVLDLNVAFDKPLLERKIAIYNLLQLPVTFAILSTKKLFKILKFPLYLDLGQINCDLLVNYEEYIFTESEMNDIKLCHFALFQKVTGILKNSQVFDNRNKENSFYVVPVEKRDGRFVLSWDLIRLDFCKNNNSALVSYNPTFQPVQKKQFDFKSKIQFLSGNTTLIPLAPTWNFDSEKLRNPKFEFNEAAYKYFVIKPNYRNIDPPQYYIVSKLCTDMSPLSPFPRINYQNYAHYYKEKYFIEITNTSQPLLRASPLYSCSNFNKPRLKKLRSAKEKYREYEEHLIPELCDVYPFDRKYWVKALLLPTVLNRICHAYCLEEFRRRIVAETDLGWPELPDEADWNPLEMDEACGVVEEEEEGLNNFAKSANDLQTLLPLSKLKDETQRNCEIIIDPERRMYDIGLCDLEFYVRKLQEVEKLEVEGGDIEEAEILARKELLKLEARKNILIPPLKILSCSKDSFGPDLSQMIQICTAKSANDIVDYERLETLGDSFLKFAVTLYLFRNYSYNEGILSAVKSKIIGNRNLLYCGQAKGIQGLINVTDFVPLSDWNPPLLHVPEILVNEIISNRIDPAVLYRLEIPFEEQFSGVLSEATIIKNQEIINIHEKYWEMPTNTLLPYKSVEDKTISDCVEAFIGAYLLTLGISGALDFLLWLGILTDRKGTYSELIKKRYYPTTIKCNSDLSVMTLLNEIFYSDLESTLDYSFQNKALLLEAITHPSYARNRITHCYQRLELLGDAIIDFLITTYIYENCGHLTPGQITDIRSSLVNNITFACLVVRYQLYKYLLFFNSTLSKAIENFVSFQVNRNHMVDDNVLVLLDEDDVTVGEAILVPKALGDLFESLAAAIYLDSGNSLETVWKVYYRLMKPEIDQFTKNIPKTAVRLLQEICGDKPYYECKVVRGFTKVTCSIYFENREIKVHGFGANKKEGKRSAAKLILNKLLDLKKGEA